MGNNTNSRIIAATALLLAATLFAGCGRGNVTVRMADPKVYGEDLLARQLSKQRKGLLTTVGTIDAAAVNQLTGVREASRFDLDLQARPATLGADGVTPQLTLTPADPATMPAIALPAAPTGSVTLMADSMLRRRIDLAQNILAYDLLYHGDLDFLDPKRRYALLRFDFSVLGSSDPETDMEFIPIVVKVDGLKKPRLVALAPEFSAILTEESYVNSAIQTYAARLGGVYQGVEGAGTARQQYALEESFKQLMEQPLQYSVYSTSTGNTATAALAIGPERILIESHWLTRFFLWLPQYRVNYRIQPGTRDFYMLLSYDAGEAEEVTANVTAHLPNGIMPIDDLYLAEAIDRMVTDGSNRSCGVMATACETTLVLPGKTDAQSSASPVLIGTASSVVIEGGPSDVFTSESTVEIGGYHVPAAHTEVLGRRSLRVLLPEKFPFVLVPESKTVNVIVRTPDKAKAFTIIAELKSPPAPPTPPPPPDVQFAVSPEKVGHGEEVTVKILSTNMQIAFAEAYRSGNVPPATIDGFTIPGGASFDPLANTLKFRVPNSNPGNSPAGEAVILFTLDLPGTPNTVIEAGKVTIEM